MPALRVLIYSVYETESPHPFVVLVLPDVSDAVRKELAEIAEDVIPVQQLAYPYDGKVKFELGINKQCRYSKLHLWAQTQFRSLIYLDVDTAVQKVRMSNPYASGRNTPPESACADWHLVKRRNRADLLRTACRTSTISSRLQPTLPAFVTSAM